MYFENIESTADLKKLSYDQLTCLAAELRTELIDRISRKGGHLGSNLGIIELTIPLLSTSVHKKEKALRLRKKTGKRQAEKFLPIFQKCSTK